MSTFLAGPRRRCIPTITGTAELQAPSNGRNEVQVIRGEAFFVGYRHRGFLLTQSQLIRNGIKTSYGSTFYPKRNVALRTIMQYPRLNLPSIRRSNTFTHLECHLSVKGGQHGDCALNRIFFVPHNPLWWRYYPAKCR